MAYRDAVSSVTPTDGPRRRVPGWAVAEGPFGIRLFDLGIVALVIAAIELDVITGSGPGAVRLDLRAYLFGALLAAPILFRHRWPFQVMLACAALIFFYYIFARRNISPAPVFFVPLYDATLAGYLIWAVSIASGFMLTGLVVVEVSTRQGLASLFQEFLSQIVILVLAVTAGKVVRSRQILAAETAIRLRLASRARPRRGAHGRQHAGGRRGHGHPSDRQRSPARRDQGRRADHVRRRGDRVRGAAGRRQRIPGQGRGTGRAAASGPGRGPRRRAAVPQRDPGRHRRVHDGRRSAGGASGSSWSARSPPRPTSAGRWSN
jgi:hypothetical protein